MLDGRKFSGKRLPLTVGFALLLVSAFGAGCKGFFVNPTLTSITINPATPSVELGSTATLQAYGVNSNNQGMYLTSGVSWSSSDSTTAAITGACATAACGSATVSGLALGTATITAASESVTNTATLNVYITVSTLTITPQTQSIAAGGTTAAPYIVTANGNTDISSGAVLTAYTAGGTQQTTITCTYDASGAGGAGQYCTDNGSPTGTYTIVATYTQTTITAKATLNIT